jgi:hypothetical protein
MKCLRPIHSDLETVYPMPQTLQKKLCVLRNPLGVRCSDANWINGINAASISAPACRATQRWWCEFMRLATRNKKGIMASSVYIFQAAPSFSPTSSMQLCVCRIVFRENLDLWAARWNAFMSSFSRLLLFLWRAEAHFTLILDELFRRACRRLFYRRRFFV